MVQKVEQDVQKCCIKYCPVLYGVYSKTARKSEKVVGCADMKRWLK
jgi:hypothetical protein